MKKFCLLSLCLSSLLFAENNAELEALFNLSLEELLNVEVTTSTQEKESLLETPAIVSVITCQQLKEWGVQNVYEALSFLPGIVINETYMGTTAVTFRGVTPGLFNNKALFMINSHPVYERLFGSAQVEYIPLEIIERIEVIRSPASVLYGTQAISGVVNIITKQDTDSETTLRTGSYDHYYGSATIHNAYLTMSGSLQKDNGYDFSGTNDEFGNPINLGYQNDINNLYADLHGESWRVQGGYFKQEKARYGFNPWQWLHGNNEQESFYIDLYKSFEIDTGLLEMTLRYDYSDKEYSAGEFPFPAPHPTDNGEADTSSTLFNTVQRYSGELKYKDSAFRNLHYIVGASFEYDQSNPMVFKYDADGSINPSGGFPDKHDFENYAAFVQVKYKFSQIWSAVVGVRTEDNTDTGYSGFIPRLGLTYKLTDETYIKALYSEAFRAPVFLEKYSLVPGFLFGKEDLDREKIKTYELAVDSRLNNKNTLQVAAFFLSLEDEITRRPVPATTATEYYNAKGRTIYGVEASWLSLINDKTDLSLNASYMTGEDKSLEELDPSFNDDAPFIANYTANAVLTYHLDSHWSGSISDQFVSSKEYVLKSGETGSIDNYNLANLVLTYKNRPFEGSITVKNIFDEEYTYPEPVRRNLKEVPGGPGTTAYLTLRYYF